MNLLVFLACFFVLFILELIYFKIAIKYNIIDQPNHRSSHTKTTIRGGGIIFSISLLAGSVFFGYQYYYFLIGLFLISLISFIDDVKTISNKIRIIVHLIAVMLLFYQLQIYNFPLYGIILGIAFTIGTINAINFMDGINGITGSYGLITLLTLCYINAHIVSFTTETYLILSIISVLVFNFFNFRKKARCFAGDVGSVTLAFIIAFFLLQLIIKANNFNYLLLLLVYGLDTVSTILFRIIKRENIFEAHRKHFYQFLVNEKKMSHLLVALLYVLVQGIINVLLINIPPISIVGLMALLIITMGIFILVRLGFEGKQKLFKV